MDRGNPLRERASDRGDKRLSDLAFLRLRISWLVDRLVQHRIRFVVADKLFRFGIPPQLLAEPNADMPQMPQRGHPMADFRRFQSRLATPHAIDEILFFALQPKRLVIRLEFDVHQ